ncbi:AI-2E family transporter, partial [Bacillus velezensis]|uniref:AI-2E family transporter n=2 Tax=Bacillati TaxID=1783272 RepID=UPI003EE48CCD
FCALFLLADDGSIWRWIVRLLPRGAHNHVDLAGAAAWRTLVVYMRSLVLLALLNAAAMLPVLWFADVPLAVPLTVVIFLGSLIPLVGVLLAAALMFAIAFVGNGLVTALVLVAILTVLVQLLGNLVNPLILGRFVDLHPVVILIGV